MNTMHLAHHVVLSQNNGDTVLLDTHTGQYWHINELGVAVLNGFTSGEVLEDIAHRIATEHNVSTEIALRDCKALIQQLKSAKLLKKTK